MIKNCFLCLEQFRDFPDNFRTNNVTNGIGSCSPGERKIGLVWLFFLHLKITESVRPHEGKN